MQPESKMDKGKCRDTKKCAQAKADLQRVLAADKEQLLRRDHWEDPRHQPRKKLP